MPVSLFEPRTMFEMVNLSSIDSSATPSPVNSIDL